MENGNPIPERKAKRKPGRERKQLPRVASPLADMWANMILQNPYPKGGHKWYTFAYICRITVGWAMTVDRMQHIKDKELKELYVPTASHHAARIAAAADLLKTLHFASEADPLYKKRISRTKSQNERGL